MMKESRLTYQDYAALPDDGRRYQVLDGELCVRPAPGLPHQEISANLMAALHGHVKANGLGKVYSAPVDVVLSEAPGATSIVQPDIVFVATDRLERRSARGIEGAPTLVVEILSPTTAALDRRRKRELYARHGVPYYWIVDGEARAVEMYELVGQAYELLARATGDAPVTAGPFPGLALTDLWP
jgi:Uma2 family endonuclease